tara:strand:+ start:939 stop:2051 length:1113 start_codon:yes stop_codon:yes gene_type:complete
MIKKIKFVDLNKINKPFKKEFLKSLDEIYRTNSFIKSKYNKLLEKKICKTFKSKFCLTLNSGTDALIVAIKALGLKKGDEILTTSNTWISSAYAISLNDCKPIFVDIDNKYFQMDEKLLSKKLTKRTKAIIVTHLYGNPCEMSRICKFAKKNNLYIIEDIAQAHLAKYKNKIVGNFGDIGCMSFYPSKNLGAIGDGGAIITNSKKMIFRCTQIANYGSTNFKDKDHKVVGYNSRMDEVQAAFLNLKIQDLKRNNNLRRNLAVIYNNKCDLMGIKRIYERPYSKNVYHIYPIIVKNRNLLLKKLKEKNIEAQIHYEIPIHLQKVYKKFKNLNLKITNHISKKIISLPFYPGITKNQINYLFEVIYKNKKLI